MPVVKMPDNQLVRFPDDHKPEQIRDFIYENFPDENPLNQGNEFTRGLKRGLSTTTALVQEGLPGVGKGLGNEILNTLGYDDYFEPEKNLQEYNEKVQEAYSKYPTSTPSFRDIEGIGDLGDYVASSAGEVIPQLGFSLATGGVGGIGTKQGAQFLAKRAGKKLTEKQLQNALTKGALAGTLTSSGSMNVPESYFNLLEQGADEPSKALIVGGLKTSLDILPQMKLLEKVLGPQASDVVADTLLKRMGQQGLQTAVQEGVTESAQEGLDVVAEAFILENEEIFSRENIDRMIDSGLKGAIGGGIAGASLSPMMGEGSFDYEKLSPQKKQELESQFQEEVLGDVPQPITTSLDDSILTPAYLDDQTLEQAETLGISKESLTFLSPQEVQDVNESFETINTANDINEVYNTPTLKVLEQNARPLQARAIAMNDTTENGKRFDNFFLPGDGEIVVGAPVDTDVNQTKDLLSTVKVNNHEALEKEGIAFLQRLQPNFPKSESNIGGIDSLGFYSKMDRRLVEKLPNKISLKELENFLETSVNKGEIKEDELAFSTLLDEIKIAESFDPTATNTKYSKDNILKTAFASGTWLQQEDGGTRYSDITLEKKQKDPTYEYNILRLPAFRGDGFDGDHSERSNVVGHWRATDKNIDGVQTKFVEEIQSDWHQKGAKEGYNIGDRNVRKKALRKAVEKFEKENVTQELSLVEEGGPSHNEAKIFGDLGIVTLENNGAVNANRIYVFSFINPTTTIDQIVKALEAGEMSTVLTMENIYEGGTFENLKTMAYSEFNDEILDLQREKVAKGPFSKTWPSLILKRILLDAAKKGYTQIALPKKEAVAEIQGHDDFRAGPFYEKTLVNEAKKLGKKYGFKVEDVEYKANLSENHEKKYAEFHLKELESLIENKIRSVIDFGQRHGKTDFMSSDVFDYLEEGTTNNKDLNELLLNPSFQNFFKDLEAFKIDYATTLKRLEELSLKEKRYPLTLIKLSPETITKINDEGMPLFQKMSLPYAENLRDSFVAPQVLAKNLKGIKLSEKGLKREKDVVNRVKKIVKEVTGTTPNLSFFEKLTDFENNPVAGAQVFNNIYVAINTSTTADIDETALHELFHYLENNGAFTEKELQILDNNTDKLIDYMNQDGFLKTQDYEVLRATNEGRQELRANAFGKYAVEHLNKVKNKTKIDPVFKRVFNKVMNIIERMRNALKGLGFRSFDDIFIDAVEGRKAITEANYTNAYTRHQRIAEGYQQKHSDHLTDYDNFKEIAEEFTSVQNKNFDSGKKMGMFGMFINSMIHAANKHPALAPLVAAVQQRDANSSFLMQKYVDILGDFTRLSKGQRHRLHELGAYMRKTRQKAKLDPEGRLTFERDGKIVRLNDVAMSEQYMKMQAAYREVLDDRFKLMQKDFRSALEAEEVILDEEFTLQQVEAERELADPSNENLIEILDNLIEQFNTYDVLTKSDYVPSIRFGPWGITVRDKESGEQVAFYTVEKGDFGADYSSYQLEQTLKALKEKYSDTDKYEIIGDKGRITDLSSVKNIQPFKLTQAVLSNQVDPRFLNLELLAGMLNERSLDVKEYEKMRTKILAESEMRSFDKHFHKAEFLDGHSTDWNRVQHAYLSAGAHHLANQPFKKVFSALRSEYGKLKDDNVRKRAEKYLDYVGSPAEDLIALRTFNFLWTMGGNVSTAALQMFTLPTTTLGGMTQFNPNALSNMKRISKWFAIGIDLAPMGIYNTQDGIAHLDFGNRERWQPLIDKGKVSQEMVDLFIRLDREGKIRGLLTEESIGSRQFETRSKAGKVREAMRTSANFLGLPITVMEQLTRFATTAAMYDMLMNNPQALQRAEKIYGNNPLFQAKQKLTPNKKFVDIAAEFAMDEAHAVFGKVGRPLWMKSAGGALFFPFMTYPHQALEFMTRMMGRGADGRRGAYTTIAALFLLSGLLGLPGAELLKELLEELEKQITGSEEDFDFMIRKKIVEMGGDPNFAKFITQGVGRGFWGMDISRRIGLPIPGQDLLFNILGVRGTSADLFGVSGSVLGGVAQAWNSYNQGAGTAKVLSSMLPVMPANIAKAVMYGDSGVQSRSGYQLLTPEDVTLKTQIARAIGITSDQVATKREELYWKQLTDNKHRTAIERFRNKAKTFLTQRERARKKGDFEKVKALNDKLKNVMIELQTYEKENQLISDPSAFIRSVMKSAEQRLEGELDLRQIRRNTKKDIPEIKKTLGLEY